MKENRSLFLQIFLLFFPFYLTGEAVIDTSSWKSTHFIWNFGLAVLCDKGPKEFPYCKWKEETFDDLSSGDIVWLQSYYVPLFYNTILPKLETPIVLVISDGDESFPSNFTHLIDVEDLIQHPYLIHIFAQNCDYKGPHRHKVTPIPIGIDFHTRAHRIPFKEKTTQTPEQQESILNAVLQTFKPTDKRKKRIYVDFHLHDTLANGCFQRYLEVGETRSEIFSKIQTTNLVDVSKFQSRTSLWKTKGEYAFSICPPGNGLDTHRIWEDLVLGCIVIVKHSPLDLLYRGLPVIFIQDWNEITEANLNKWLSQYPDAFTNPLFREKLTNRYWFSKIQQPSKPYKNR